MLPGLPPPRAWSLAAWALVVANLAPLVGVFALGWSVGPMLWFYWLENLVVGLFAALRIACARGGHGAIRFFLVPFFLAHYGMFCFVHGVFLRLIVRRGEGEFDAGHFFSLADAFAAPGAGWLLLALLASHGASFVLLYLRGGERDRTTAEAEMARPYGRVVAMHLTVMAGGAAMIFLGAPAVALAGLAAAKTALDLRAHFRAHAPAPPPAPTA